MESSLKAIIATALAAGASVAANPQGKRDPRTIVDDSQCDCFLTNGSSPTFFSNHIFFDFRSLTAHAIANPPPLVANASQAAIAPVSSSYFAADPWNRTWQIQGWDNTNPSGHGLAGSSTILMVHSQSNIFIQKNRDQNQDAASESSTYLSLRTKRLPGFQTTAAFQSRSRAFRYISIRALARTVGSPGAVTGMFTYRQSQTNSGEQEADLEVLTKGPRETVQYTNQPGFNPDGSRNTEASHNVTLPNSLLWSGWAVHRLDWTPTSSVWYVNGVQMANISTQVPRDAASLNFNAWSDGGPWSGNMSVYDEASLQIQWIDVVYNASTASDDSEGHDQCRVVCSIDEDPELGKTALLWNSTASRLAGAGLRRSLAWIWSVMIGATLWYCLV